MTDTTLRPTRVALGPVHLTVRDLGAMTAFYEDALALTAGERTADVARLGAGGEDLVVLHADPSAPAATRHAGLFHLALLYPERSELARAVTRLLETRTPVQGAADHGVSEAIYLPDAEGNGIELYADRPRELWPGPTAPGERVGMTTEALDLDDLLATAPAGGHHDAAPAGLVVGHVHLHVGDLAAAEGFHGGVLGMDVMQHYPGASFLSVAGYHHHVAVNTWRGRGVPPAPDGARGLRNWTLHVPDDEARDALVARAAAAGTPTERRDGITVLTDPAGIRVAVTA
jgi:catechol 2,3-dioxygenase